MPTSAAAAFTLTSTPPSDPTPIPTPHSHTTRRGNLLWNGPADHPLGLGDTTGCRNSNPTCNEALIRSQNYVNTRRPVLTPSFRPTPGGGLGGLPLLVRPLPAFPAWAAGNSAPAGTLANIVAADKSGALRAVAATDAPGAWILPGSGPAMPAPPPVRRPPPTPVRRPPPSSGQEHPPPNPRARPPPHHPPTSRPPPPKAVLHPPPPVRPSPPASHGAFWLPTGEPFAIGSLTGMNHLWVDPVGGADGAGRGGSRSNALRTLAAAWQRLPIRQQLTRGWHIHITPGALTDVQSELWLPCCCLRACMLRRRPRVLTVSSWQLLPLLGQF